MLVPADPNTSENAILKEAYATNSPSTRILTLDVLRGIAILGMLFTLIWNVGGFGINEQALVRTQTHGGNYKLLSAVSILFEGKMTALLALVFGAGLVLLLQKKEYPSSLEAPDIYMRRKLCLLVLGVFTAIILLYPNDILFPFAIMGILLFPFTRLKPKGLFIAAAVCLLIFCSKTYWDYADNKSSYKKFLVIKQVEKQFSKDSLERSRLDSVWALQKGIIKKSLTEDSLARKALNDTIAKLKKDSALNHFFDASLTALAIKDTLTSKQKKEKGAWEGTLSSSRYDSSATKEMKKSIRASYGGVYETILPISQANEGAWLYSTGIWEFSSMMLLGMALLSVGFLSEKYSKGRYLLIGIVLVTVGFSLAWLRISLRDDKLVDYTKYIEKRLIPPSQFRPLEQMLLAIGYASIVIGLIRARFLGWIWWAFAAIGRMPLTNYMMQVIISTVFFYGYGMGYYGRLSQWQLYLFVIETCILQIIFSIFWLRYFLIGPFEWLFGWVVYGRKPVWKKPALTGNETTADFLTEHSH